MAQRWDSCFFQPAKTLISFENALTSEAIEVEIRFACFLLIAPRHFLPHRPQE